MTEDQVGAIVVGVLAAVLGPLVWWVTDRAAAGSLAKNHFVGLRTGRTLASEDAWRTGHRAALPWARRTALGTVGLGVVAVVIALAGPWQAAVAVGLVALGVVLVGSLVATLAAHRAAGQVSPR